MKQTRLSFFILNGESILSSARKTTFYPRDKNHAELTERQMKTMNKQIYSKLIGYNNIELSDKFNITKKIFINFDLFIGEFVTLQFVK